MRRLRAFTLVEILVVLSLFAVLMGLGVGMIQRAGSGNMLTQTTNAMANLLAAARAGAYGSATAYVTVDSSAAGVTVMSGISGVARISVKALSKTSVG